PTGLLPMTRSPSVVVVEEEEALPRPGRLTARRPMAKTAGSPAPASRPTTTIRHSASRSIQEFMAVFLGSLGESCGWGAAVSQAATASCRESAGAAEPSHSSLTLWWLTGVLRACRYSAAEA